MGLKGRPKDGLIKGRPKDELMSGPKGRAYGWP